MLPNLCLLSLTGISMLAALSSVQAEDVWSGPQHPEQEKDWKFELGGGAMFGPKYEGSDNYTVMPFPNASIEYKNGLFFANGGDGIGSYPLQGENYKVGASIGSAMGRSEDDDKDNLRGMGEIDTGVVGNLMGEYDIGPLKLSGKLTKSNDDYGMTAEADLGTMFPVTEKLMVIWKIGAKWADEDQMNTYFGVSPTQSAHSGYARYHAESGFKSVGVTVGAFYNITEHWDAMLMVNGDQLIGDAADSPITKQEFQPMALLGVSYQF